MSSNNYLIALQKIAQIFTDQSLSWLIGGSGALLLHGLPVTPRDIDLVVDPADYPQAKKLLANFITGEMESANTSFEIEHIPGELLALPVDAAKLTTLYVNNVPVYVHKLEEEYRYYSNRPATPKNSYKLRLIKAKLDKQS